MPKNDETNASGQAGECGCLGCQMHRLVIEHVAKRDAAGEGEQIIDDIVDAVASVIGNMMAFSAARETRVGLEEIRKRSIRAKAVFERMKGDGKSTRH